MQRYARMDREESLALRTVHPTNPSVGIGRVRDPVLKEPIIGNLACTRPCEFLRTFTGVTIHRPYQTDCMRSQHHHLL